MVANISKQKGGLFPLSNAVKKSLWRGLVGAWFPALGPTGNVLRDISGLGRHGDLTSMVPGDDWIISHRGKYGNGYALDMDGVQDHVQVNDPVQGEPPFTVCILLKTDETGGVNYIIANGGETSKSGFAIYQASGTNYDFYVKSSNSSTAGNLSTSGVNNDKYQFLVGTWDGSTTSNAIKFYIDGILKAQATAGGGASTASNNLRIGSASASTNNTINAKYAAVLIYDRVLPAAEITELQHSLFDGFFETTSGRTVFGSELVMPGGACGKRADYKAGFARNAGESQHPEIWRGVKYAWNPGLGPTGKTVHDWGGKSNSAVLTNFTPAAGWVLDRNGYSIRISGSDDRLQLDSYVAFADDKNWSISVWVNVANMGNFRMIWGNPTGTSRFFVGSTQFYHYDEAGNSVTFSHTVSVQEWHHVVLTQHTEDSIRQNMSLYVDGVFKEVKQKVVADAAMQFNTFGIGSGDTHALQGDIKDMVVYDRLLPAAMISRMYRLGMGAMYNKKERILKAPVAVGGGALANRRSRLTSLVGGTLV